MSSVAQSDIHEVQKADPCGRGFTLIELLVVIAIIGVLAGTIAFSFADKPDEARYTRVIAEFKTLNTVVKAFKMDHKRYPESLEELVEGPEHPMTQQPTEYVDEVPLDPWTDEPYEMQIDEDGKPYFISWGSDMTEGGEGFGADIYSNRRQNEGH